MMMMKNGKIQYVEINCLLVIAFAHQPRLGLALGFTILL